MHHDEDTITDGSLFDWRVGRCQGGWRQVRGSVAGRRRGFLLAGAPWPGHVRTWAASLEVRSAVIGCRALARSRQLWRGAARVSALFYLG